jgi:hypothetical protein
MCVTLEYAKMNIVWAKMVLSLATLLMKKQSSLSQCAALWKVMPHSSQLLKMEIEILFAAFLELL